MLVNTLRTKADAIEDFLIKHFLDGNNVVYTQLNRNTLRPPEESLFPDFEPGMNHQDWYIQGYTRSEFAAYENCGMCTGAYMQSLVFQYRVEQDPRIRERMTRCFLALKYIVDLGKKLEEGFFPKIYGNRFSSQTSSDQVLYAVLALDQFYAFASPQQKKEIDLMIPQMVNFWVKRNYIYPYYEVRDKHWPLQRFPPLLILAYKHSGNALFKKEYDELGLGLTAKPEFAQLKMKKEGVMALSQYEQKQHAYSISAMSCGAAMDWMNFDCLISNDPGNDLCAKWKEGILTMWDEARITLAPNGKHYMQLLVDMDTGATRRPLGYAKGEPPGCESGWSTLLASGAVIAAKYYPGRADIKESVLKVLAQLDVPDMTYFDDPERFEPRQRFKTRFLSGDSVTNWLWAYWQGRHQHMFGNNNPRKE